jgi:hypothetical protein
MSERLSESLENDLERVRLLLLGKWRLRSRSLERSESELEFELSESEFDDDEPELEDEDDLIRIDVLNVDGRQENEGEEPFGFLSRAVCSAFDILLSLLLFRL